MVSFPYHSHIFRDSYGSGMGSIGSTGTYWTLEKQTVMVEEKNGVPPTRHFFGGVKRICFQI